MAPNNTNKGGESMVITDPLPTDVIFGNGACFYKHQGNRNLREYLSSRYEEYEAVSTRDKRKFAEKLYDEIRASGVRFLERSPDNDSNWVEADRNAVVFKKFMQRLRDERNERAEKKKSKVESLVNVRRSRRTLAGTRTQAKPQLDFSSLQKTATKQKLEMLHQSAFIAGSSELSQINCRIASLEPILPVNNVTPRRASVESQTMVEFLNTLDYLEDIDELPAGKETVYR